MDLSLSRDINGNKTLKLSCPGIRGFSVQTNGNLPDTHRMTKHDLDRNIAINELNSYIMIYGTDRQKLILKYLAYLYGQFVNVWNN